MNGDHSNRQPNQKPSEWTNMTFDLPGYDLSVQFTANKSSYAEEIPYYVVDEYRGCIFVSFVWWGSSWELLVGIETF